jgi:hypothetical protein
MPSQKVKLREWVSARPRELRWELEWESALGWESASGLTDLNLYPQEVESVQE